MWVLQAKEKLTAPSAGEQVCQHPIACIMICKRTGLIYVRASCWTTSSLCWFCRHRRNTKIGEQFIIYLHVYTPPQS